MLMNVAVIKIMLSKSSKMCNLAKKVASFCLVIFHLMSPFCVS